MAVNPRRKARVAALQALYESDMSTHAALAALGQHERALDFLERVQPRGVLRWDVLKAPEFDSIRSHPRFQSLVGESRPR